MGLSRHLVVEHVGEWHEGIGLDLVDGDTEDPARHDHTHLSVLLEVKLLEGGHFQANEVIVLLDLINLFLNLISKATSLEPLLLIIREEHRELGHVLWQQFDIRLPRRAVLLDLLKHVGTEEIVLRRDESLPEAFLVH